MWFTDLYARFWNGLTTWDGLIFHVFYIWASHEFYNAARHGNWYEFGFPVGASSRLMVALG